MLRIVVASDSGGSFSRELAEERLTIGRSSTAGLTLDDRFLSREHAVLLRDNDELVIDDLESRNGTTVNDVRIAGPTRLQPGDRVGLGRYTLTVAPATTTGADAAHALSDSLEASILIPASRLLEQGFDFATPGASVPQGAVNELERYLERLRLLDEVHRSLARSISLDELLELILDRVFDHLGPEEGVVVLKREGGTYEIVARRRVPGLAGNTFYSETLIREVAVKRQGALVLDAQTDQRFAEAASILGSGVRSIVAAPLAVDDESLGMIAMSSRLSERQFEERDLELLGSLASVAALRIRNVGLAVQAAERQKLEAEVALARTIQEELLPAELPEVPGYEVVGINRPSRGVSGDLYQVVETDSQGNFYFLLYDVSGKGLAAALLTATIDALAAAPIANDLPVDRLFTLINTRLERRTSADRFATAFAARMSTATGLIEYASAGHNPALLVRSSGAPERLPRTGLPLGVMTDGRYEARELELAGGDLLVVYTDGITEAANRQTDEYGLDRLEQVCAQNRDLPIERIAAAIELDVAQFAAGVPFEDDQTLLLLRRSPPGPM